MTSRILIVDDDLEIQELLRFTFESEHYQVSTASDGEEGLRRTTEERPDIVVLDVNMPKMSGFEVCEKIRENPTTCLIPVIMLTSLAKAKDKITGIKLGAIEYLSKPFEPLELVARVDGVLQRTREFIAANPLTGIPGNISIENEIKRRLEMKETFAVIYTDADNFKAFNDKYGFEKGDAVIRLISVILRNAVTEQGNMNDFVGHIGGEDFVIVTTPEKAKALCERVIKDFDSLVAQQYDADVRARGYLWGVDRQGQEVKFPIMTLSLGIAVVEPAKFQHYSQIVERSKEMLKKAKARQGSTFEVG